MKTPEYGHLPVIPTSLLLPSPTPFRLQLPAQVRGHLHEDIHSRDEPHVQGALSHEKTLRHEFELG